MIRAVVVVLLLVAGVAAADGERPWAEGVSQEQQERANQLYEQGNGEFAQYRYAEALAFYRQALESWDHPLTRFNAAVCLVHLEQPVAALAQLRAALRHGAAPFRPETYG